MIIFLSNLLVDKMLDAFSNQENVWQYCVYFLQHSTSQYTLMYALHIMEVSLRVFFNVIDCSLSLSLSHPLDYYCLQVVIIFIYSQT